nr:RNA-directed DNA polymerase like [Tanacetum cinerariifolium]
MRFCIDYRELDRITVRNKYPLPRIKDLFDQLQGEKFFLEINLRSGYHRLCVKEQEAFLGHIVSADGIIIDPSKVKAITKWPTPMTVTEKGLGRVLMLHGMVIAYALRQLKPYECISVGNANFICEEKDGSMRFCIDYWELNRITVRNKYPLPRIKDLFDQIQGEKFFLEINLRQFVKEFIDDILVYSKTKEEHKYHLADGIIIDPSKVKAITKWPTPMTVTEKGEKFFWNKEREKSFEELKED